MRRGCVCPAAADFEGLSGAVVADAATVNRLRTSPWQVNASAACFLFVSAFTSAHASEQRADDAPGQIAAEKSELTEEVDDGPRVLPLAVGMGTAYAGATVWYLIDPVNNEQDWHYDYSWETLKKKLITGEAIRTDANPLYLNSPGHPLAGTTYYLLARYSRFSPASSFLVTSMGALVWELVTEFREEMSINDMVMTPVGGFAFGESLYSLASLLEGTLQLPQKSHWRWLLPSRSLAAVLMGQGSARLLDDQGLPDDVWYRLGVSAGTQVHGGRDIIVGGEVAFESRLVHSASYDRPGAVVEAYLFPFATRTHLSATLGARGVEEARLHAEVTYAVLYAQQVSAEGGLHGAEGFVGLSALFEHVEEHRVDMDDQLGAVALFGVETHAALLLGPLRSRLSGQVYPVFAGVHSPAWSQLANQVSASEPPVVLGRWGYYWAAGLLFSAQLTLEYRDVTWLQWEARRYQLSAAEDWVNRAREGEERFDKRASQALSLTQALPWNHWWARVTVERAWRQSLYGTVTVDRDVYGARLALLWGVSR